MKCNVIELSGCDFFKMKWSSVAGIATRLQARQPRVQIPVAARDFSLFHNIHTWSGAHLVPYSLGARVLPWE
jgi:hypothetical protein